MANKTISFEVSGGKMRGVEMPDEAVMGQHRFSRLWEDYGSHLRFNTHTDSGNPELTFLCEEADYIYEITDASGRFMQLRLISAVYDRERSE